MTVLIAGTPVAASQPARIEGGAIVVPVDPVVRDLAQVVTIDRPGRRVTIRRNGSSTVVAFASVACEDPEGEIYVPLAPVVRALGGTIRFDAVRKVAEVEMPAPAPVTTPTPFDSSNASAIPTEAVTPKPTVTPSPGPAALPKPRRTPIPVTPSYPALEGR